MDNIEILLAAQVKANSLNLTTAADLLGVNAGGWMWEQLAAYEENERYADENPEPPSIFDDTEPDPDPISKDDRLVEDLRDYLFSRWIKRFGIDMIRAMIRNGITSIGFCGVDFRFDRLPEAMSHCEDFMPDQHDQWQKICKLQLEFETQSRDWIASLDTPGYTPHDFFGGDLA